MDKNLDSLLLQHANPKIVQAFASMPGRAQEQLLGEIAARVKYKCLRIEF